MLQRVSLPGYPFNRERYWVPLLASAAEEEDIVTTPLHPLLHRNESTLHVQKYKSHFYGGEVVLRDHQVSGQKVLPGAASLEMALAGASRALGNPDVRLRQVVWMRPLAAGTDGLSIELPLWLESDGRVSFELKGPNGDVHVQGKAEVTAGFSEETVDLNAIRDRCLGVISPNVLYPAFTDRGLEYGTGFRVIQEIRYSATGGFECRPGAAGMGCRQVSTASGPGGWSAAKLGSDRGWSGRSGVALCRERGGVQRIFAESLLRTRTS